MSTVIQTAHSPKKSPQVLCVLLFIMQISNRKADTLLSGYQLLLNVGDNGDIKKQW